MTRTDARAPPPPRNDELCFFEIGRCWIYKAIISCNSDPLKKKQTFNMRTFNAVFERACVLPTIKSKPQWFSTCLYRKSILSALYNLANFDLLCTLHTHNKRFYLGKLSKREFVYFSDTSLFILSDCVWELINILTTICTPHTSAHPSTHTYTHSLLSAYSMLFWYKCIKIK